MIAAFNHSQMKMEIIGSVALNQASIIFLLVIKQEKV